MAKKPDKEELKLLLRSLMDNPETIIDALLQDWIQAETMKEGCQKILDNAGKLDNPENMKKQLVTAVKLNKSLSSMNSRLALLMLIYASSSEFKSSCAAMRMRLGDKKALADLFASKIKGAW
jgi:hypothetical protein